MIHLGDFPANHTAVCIPWDSFAAASGASSAASNFVAGDVQIYKDGGTTQRASSAGITVSTSFDSLTGLQMVVIDLSDNSDAGFYAAGHEYQVGIADVTVDTQTVRFWAASFSIERALGELALTKLIKAKTDSLTFTVGGMVDSNVVDWKGATAPAMTGDAYARLGAPAGASIAADIAAVKTDSAAIKVQTDKLTFTVANQIDANVLDWKGSTAPAMTGDAYARLGAPAGASVSADIAAVKTDTAAVKVQTDKLTFTIANQIDANVLDWKSSTAPAMTGDAYARLGAPAGASISADIAAVNALTTAGAIRAAIGIASANLDTQLGTIAGYIDTEIGTIISQTTASAIRAAMGEASANLDTQLAAIAGYIDTEISDIRARLPAALTGAGNMKVDVLALNGDTTAADQLRAGALGLVLGTVGTGSTLTVIETNLTEATNDHYNGHAIVWLTGALRGQVSTVSGYNGTTKQLTVVAVTDAASNGDLFILT